MSVDRDSLKQVVGVASANYRCRPKKTFIINTPWTVNILWKFVKGFLHATTKAKISISGDSSPPELREMFHPS
jgi:hypothetical protein